MANSSTNQMRQWSGPAIFTYGFRPFFFFAGFWATVAMLLWIPALTGAIALPTQFDPVSWHAHEFLFGYLGAVLAGFLLTAVPNWTGQLPVVGWKLAALFGLWVIGRIAVLFSASVPAGLVAAADLSFPVVLAGLILREIVAGKNWRNLIVFAMLTVFALSNAVFHIEGHAQGYGLRLGLGAGIMMISVIGGRIIPSFTRNWLVKQGATALPVPPMQKLDKVTLLFTVATLLIWVVAPFALLTAVALFGVATLHALRLSRWQGHKTAKEPLVLILHLAYAFVPLGALALSISVIWPQIVPYTAALHLWTAGAIGLMTLSVMTRATLGHTGQALTASRGTLVIFGAMIVAALTRTLAGIAGPSWLIDLSGGAWLLSFAMFCATYGPLLWRARK